MRTRIKKVIAAAAALVTVTTAAVTGLSSGGASVARSPLCWRGIQGGPELQAAVTRRGWGD